MSDMTKKSGLYWWSSLQGWFAEPEPKAKPRRRPRVKKASKLW